MGPSTYRGAVIAKVGTGGSVGGITDNQRGVMGGIDSRSGWGYIPYVLIDGRRYHRMEADFCFREALSVRYFFVLTALIAASGSAYPQVYFPLHVGDM